MGKVDIELDAGIKRAFADDRASALTRSSTFQDRLLEWTIPLLWLAVAAVIVAVFVWL